MEGRAGSLSPPAGRGHLGRHLPGGKLGEAWRPEVLPQLGSRRSPLSPSHAPTATRPRSLGQWRLTVTTRSMLCLLSLSSVPTVRVWGQSLLLPVAVPPVLGPLHGAGAELPVRNLSTGSLQGARRGPRRLPTRYQGPCARQAGRPTDTGHLCPAGTP